MERFSKAALARFVWKRIELLEKAPYKFDPGNGWAQVIGKGEEINRAYGEYYMLRLMLDAFDLPVPEE